MTDFASRTVLVLFAGFSIAACSGGTMTGDVDTGMGRVDMGMGGVDTGVPPVDTGVPPVDTGVPPADTGTGDVDTGTGDVDSGSGGTDSGVACQGMECPDFATALAAAPRGASGDSEAAALANCVIQLHQLDCCGRTAAYGINHGARTALCPAEDTCDATYTSPSGCTDGTYVTDTGETTMNRDDVRLRAVRPMSCAFGTCYTCETFVCTSDTCRTAPGIAGGCG